MSDWKPPRDAREVYLGDDGQPIAFCPKESLGVTDIHRAQFYQAQDLSRLEQLRERATVKTRDLGAQQVVVAIDVDDPVWTPLVDMLMPGHDWEQYRSRGERPIARGVVPRNLIAEVVSDLYPAAGNVPDDRVSVCVFAAGGVLVVT
jgi:hypothetical protein